MKQSTLLCRQGGMIRMPGKFVVLVEVLSKRDAKEEMSSQALAHYWQADHIIQLRRSRSAKARKTDLEHELQHMTVDWIDHFQRKAKVPHTKGRGKKKVSS